MKSKPVDPEADFNATPEITKLRGHLQVISDKKSKNSSLGCKLAKARDSESRTLSTAQQLEREKNLSWKQVNLGIWKSFLEGQQDKASLHLKWALSGHPHGESNSGKWLRRSPKIGTEKEGPRTLIRTVPSLTSDFHSTNSESGKPEMDVHIHACDNHRKLIPFEC